MGSGTGLQIPRCVRSAQFRRCTQHPSSTHHDRAGPAVEEGRLGGAGGQTVAAAAARHASVHGRRVAADAAIVCSRWGAAKGAKAGWRGGPANDNAVSMLAAHGLEQARKTSRQPWRAGTCVAGQLTVGVGLHTGREGKGTKNVDAPQMWEHGQQAGRRALQTGASQLTRGDQLNAGRLGLTLLKLCPISCMTEEMSHTTARGLEPSMPSL